jgi:hypothetical protein
MQRYNQRERVYKFGNKHRGIGQNKTMENGVMGVRITLKNKNKWDHILYFTSGMSIGLIGTLLWSGIFF